MSLLHILAKNGTFICRFNDGEFGSKWCGIWNGRTKYFDYFAFSIDNEWLSSKNISSFKQINSMLSILEYKTSKGNVEEKVYCTSDGIIVQLTPSYSSRIMMEPGINIRDRNENYVEGKRYQLIENKNYIKASINGKSAVIIFPGEFEKEEIYDVHIPGKYARERGFSHFFDDLSVQNKYSPGKIFVNAEGGKTYTFIFTFDNPKQIDFEKEYSEYVNELQQYGELSKLVDVLNSFANYKEGKIYAGYPYFNEFWIRDALFSLPAFLAIKKTDFVKKVLAKISEMEKDGNLPNVEGSDLYPADVPALYIIMMAKYFEETKDRGFIQRYFSRISNIAEHWRNIAEKNDWIIPDNGRQTWMDSLDRKESVEIQALWSIAFKKASDLYWQVGEGNSRMLKASIAMEDTLYKYNKGLYFKDQLNNDWNSINQIALLFTDISKERKEAIVKNLIANFLTPYGLTSSAKNDPMFNFNGYHNGAIWPFTTLLAGIAMIKYNIDAEIGRRLIESTRNLIGAQASNSINEIFRPDGKPEGCPSQLWSIAPLLFKI